jgi:hypothetical protein
LYNIIFKCFYKINEIIIKRVFVKKLLKFNLPINMGYFIYF